MTCPVVIRVTTSTGPPGVGLPAGTADAGKFVRKAGATPYAYELVTPDQVGLPQGLATTSSPTFAGLTLSSIAADRLLLVGSNGLVGSTALGSGLAVVNGALTATASGSGTVSSVALSLPGIFSVSGSPITTSGTLSATLASQTAGLVFAGPASGAAAAPTFRALTAGDIPTLSTAKITGLAVVATSGAYGDLSGRPTLGSAAPLDVAATGDASAFQVVKGDDSRLTDSRTPTAHTQAASTISDSTAAGRALLTAASAAAQRTALGLGTAATANTGTAAGNVVVLDGSGRLPAVDGSQLINLPSGGGGGGGGTVTSVGLSVPTGLAVTGSPITTSGNITISLAAGYSIPTTASQGNWDTAYSERLRWDGGSTGLNATTARTSLGLGGAAVLSVGTTAGTVAAGDDARFTTDLSYAASTRLLASSTGADVTLPLATSTDAGLLAAADKSKLDGVATGATANATDAQLRDRSTHTGTQAATTITGLAAVATSGAYADLSGKPTLGTAAATDSTAYATAAQGAKADTAIQPGNAALSDAREWTATTITQAEAEAGTATTRRAFTAERVFQAVAAWWAGSAAKTKLDGIATGATANSSDATLLSRANHTGTQSASTITGLATVATSGAYSDLSGRPTLGTAAPLDVAATGDASTTQVVKGNDSRLSDSRTPTAHTQAASTISDSTTAGRALLTAADAAAQRTALGLGSLATQSGSFSGNSSGTNTGDVTLAASVADVFSIAGQELQADDPGADRILFWDDSESKLRHLSLGTNLSITGTVLDAAGGLSDGDKGDITVSGTGATWTIDNGAVSYAKIQAVSATDRILGRSSAGAGTIEEITCTAAGRALLDDADAAAQRTTLGAAASGAIGSSGLTMATARLLGRSTTGTGAPEEISVGTGLSLSGSTLSATASGSGTKTLARFTARDNQPPASNFATLDTRNSISVLEFDAATEESAAFISVIPEGANLTSGLLVRIWWMGDTATSGNVRWAASFERSGTDLDSDSFDTATEVTSAANGTSGIETVAEITCTAIDSLAAGERFRLRIARKAADATNDTMTGDAQIVAVEVRGVA